MTDQRVEYAKDRYAWLEAFMGEGFTREEAMALLTAPQVHMAGAQLTPEMAELVERMTAVHTKILSED